MRKADRQFDIIQCLRDGRLHTGQALAARLEIFLRTLYRDIEALMTAGVPIRGERGVGYVMTEPVSLPPLNLTQGELEALELGIARVRASVGGDLAGQAQTLGDKVRAVPQRGAIGVHAAQVEPELQSVLSHLRAAILSRLVVTFTYAALSGAVSQRRAQPLEIEVWHGAFTLTGWCGERGDFRVFRFDRISDFLTPGQSFRPERGQRLQDYHARN